MARNGISEVDVVRAAEALVAQRVNPTQERIRLLLGGGSFSTISRHLKIWRAEREATQLGAAAGELGAKLGPDILAELLPPPDPVGLAVQAVWEQMHAATAAREQVTVAAAQEKVEGMQGAVAAMRAELEGAREKATAQKRADELTHARLREQRGAAQRQAATLTSELAATQAELGALRGHGKQQAQQQREALTLLTEQSAASLAQAEARVRELGTAHAAELRGSQAQQARQREDEAHRQAAVQAAHAEAEALWSTERAAWEARMQDYLTLVAAAQERARQAEGQAQRATDAAEVHLREQQALREGLRAAKVQSQAATRTAESWAQQARAAAESQAQQLANLNAGQQELARSLQAATAAFTARRLDTAVPDNG